MDRTHGMTKRLSLSGGNKTSTVYHTTHAEHLHRAWVTFGIGATTPGNHETQSRQVIMLLSAKFQIAATPAPTRLAIR